MTRTITELAAELARHEGKGDIATRSQRVAHADPRKEEDAAYRRAYGTDGKAPWGRPLRAAFYQYLPDAPTGAHISHDAARVYADRIQQVLDRDEWTKDERNRLKVLKKRWVKRASGHDARFEAMGVQGGVNEKYRKKTPDDRLKVLRDEIAKSQGRPTRPEQKFVVDPKWPFGKPNVDRPV